LRVRSEDADRQRIGEDLSALERLMGGGAERGAAEFTLSHEWGNYRQGRRMSTRRVDAPAAAAIRNRHRARGGV
jgi:hypothetical protein